MRAWSGVVAYNEHYKDKVATLEHYRIPEVSKLRQSL